MPLGFTWSIILTKVFINLPKIIARIKLNFGYPKMNALKRLQLIRYGRFNGGQILQIILGKSMLLRLTH